MSERVGSGYDVLEGGCLERLRELPAGCVNLCVTSPPYFGLRDYGLPASVWGGDADCEHEWGEALPGVRRDNQHVDVAPGNKGGGKKHSAKNQSTGDRGCWCQLCGAWRGAYGRVGSARECE